VLAFGPHTLARALLGSWPLWEHIALKIEILRVLTLGLCLGSSNDDTKIRVLPWIVAIIVGLADI
jgi:hypothetical protein